MGNHFNLIVYKIIENSRYIVRFSNHSYLQIYIKISLISHCHRSPDNLIPSNQLLTYPKTYLDVCNQLYSVSLINFGPTTQNIQPWLGGSKLHSKL